MSKSNYQIQEDYDLREHEEGNKLQKRMTNFRQHLAEKLEEMGLQIQLSPPKNTDPELAIQQEIEQLTSLLIEKTEEIIEDHLNLTELVDHNQGLILKFYAGVLSMSETMIIFSKDLYAGGQHISTFRNFKKLYDSFAEYSVLLNSYQPYSQQFEQTARKFMNKQEALLNKIIFKDDETEPQSSRQNLETELEKLKQQNQELKDVLRKYEDELNKYQPYEGQEEGQVHKQNLRLMGQLDKLQRILNENNEDFSIQIQRYNRLLYDQREEFKRVQTDLRNEIRILQYSLRQVQKQLAHCKEEKYKDQLMIESLVRKNRHLERRDSFKYISPPRGMNHTTIVPTSPKRVGIPNSLAYKKNI